MNFQFLQSYGRGGEIAVNNREDQEKAILALHLLQICVVYINALLVQRCCPIKSGWTKCSRKIFVGWRHFFMDT
jgi:TnpA family transposase